MDGCVPHLRYFLRLFLPFFLADGKARVIQPCLRSAKSQMRRSRAVHRTGPRKCCSFHQSSDDLLPSNIFLTIWFWMNWCLDQWRGKKKRNAQTSVYKYNHTLSSSVWDSVPIMCTHSAFARHCGACHILIRIGSHTNGLALLVFHCSIGGVDNIAMCRG